jgi:DNA-directed RNA polymerase specialized sigma24 family protein
MLSPERIAEANEFATGLIECLAGLRPRSRRVWVLRAVHDLSTREIAAHPDIVASEANVDVILMRTRAHLRECLGAKGLDQEHLPPGTFTKLWEGISRATIAAPAVSEGD